MVENTTKTALVVGTSGLLTAIAALAYKAKTPKDAIVLDKKTMNLLIATAQSIDNLQSQTVAIVDALKAAGIEVGMTQNVREIRIQQNVLQSQGVILVQPPPFDCYVREVKIHWPPGCNGLVDVRVGHGPKQFCPFEGFLSLDNVTPTYLFNEFVEYSENIWVEIQNTDDTFPHTISIMLNLLEKTDGKSR